MCNGHICQRWPNGFSRSQQANGPAAGESCKWSTLSTRNIRAAWPPAQGLEQLLCPQRELVPWPTGLPPAARDQSAGGSPGGRYGVREPGWGRHQIWPWDLGKFVVSPSLSFLICKGSAGRGMGDEMRRAWCLHSAVTAGGPELSQVMAAMERLKPSG